MKTDELKQHLDELGIPRAWYSINNSNPFGPLCLSQDEPNKWSVFFTERGKVLEKQEFSNENDACEHFLVSLLQDGAVKRELERLNKSKDT